MPNSAQAVALAPPSDKPRSTELLEWRERAGLTLQQIAESTKISIRFLRAIEAGEIGQLPGGIYTASYLRQYAEAIGYEASRLLARYGLEGMVEERAGREEPAGGLFGRWFGAILSARP